MRGWWAGRWRTIFTFIHFGIVVFANSLLCTDFVSTSNQRGKMSSEKELVNLLWYEVINKKSGGVDLFELTRKNVYGGKSVIQNFIVSTSLSPF